ncbi:gypsy type transposase [Tanacetum coccineum]
MEFRDLFVADGEGLPRSLVEVESKFAHQILSLFSLDADSLIHMLMMASENLSTGFGSGTRGQRSLDDANTLIRVLCHKKDKEASKFLKLNYHLPASSDYVDPPSYVSTPKSPMGAEFLRSASVRWGEKGKDSPFVRTSGSDRADVPQIPEIEGYLYTRRGTVSKHCSPPVHVLWGMDPWAIPSILASAGDAVIPKFDMHVNPSVLSSDEVNSLVAEYAIPSDLHPCVPPSGLTMNRLPADKIVSSVRFESSDHGHWFSFERRSGKGGHDKIFNEFCTSLKNWKDRFFLIDRRAIPDTMPWRHQDSSLADPAPTGVHTEDIHRLCENVIDLRPVHPAMLYTVGLTTMWKHVGHHPVFKDGEGNVATSMSQFLKFSMAGGVRVGRGTTLVANEVIPQHTTPPLPSRSQIPEKLDYQRVVEVENERVLAAKRKAQIAKDKAVGKKATKGVSHRTKKRKTVPLSFALSDSEVDESSRSGSGTHHSASPLNTIIPNEDGLATSLILEPVNQTEEGMDQPLDNVKDTTEVNSPQFDHSPQYQQSDHSIEDTQTVRSGPERTHASGSAGHGVSSTSGGSHRLAFPARHPSGDGASSSLRRDAGAPELFALQRSWFELGRGALAQIDIKQRYEALKEYYRELFESHRSCRAVSDRLTETQNQLLDTVRSRNQLSEDHQALQQVYLGCVRKGAGLVENLAVMEKERDDLLDRDREREEHIQRLEVDLVSKTSSLAKAEIVRHNYVRQLLPTVVQRLLSSGEYKKSLTDVFNLDIADGWSEGVKAACSEEEAQAFLATAVDYDPACKETFMTEFDSLFDKIYPYVEKLAESFRLPLGDLQNMWPEGTGPTLSDNAAGASTTADASNNADASDVAEAH